MELSFSSAILFLTSLFVFILYLGMNREAMRKKILRISVGVYIFLLAGWLTLVLIFRFAPERVAEFLPNLFALGELFRLLMALGWIVLAALLLRAFPADAPFPLAAAASLALSFAVILLSGNFIFSLITGA